MSSMTLTCADDLDFASHLVSVMASEAGKAIAELQRLSFITSPLLCCHTAAIIAAPYIAHLQVLWAVNRSRPLCQYLMTYVRSHLCPEYESTQSICY